MSARDTKITQEYLRRYPGSIRTKSWAGRMVHIETENGVWRTGGHGYTWAGKPDAWVLPFEQAVRQLSHCGPEKHAAFIDATPHWIATAGARKNDDGDLRMLGARDGLAHALIWVREQISAIDGRYAPAIHPRHTRKRRQRDAVLRPLKELERRILQSHAECSDAYVRSLGRRA